MRGRVDATQYDATTIGKLKLVTRSSVESEIVAQSDGSSQVIHLQEFVEL